MEFSFNYTVGIIKINLFVNHSRWFFLDILKRYGTLNRNNCLIGLATFRVGWVNFFLPIGLNLF